METGISSSRAAMRVAREGRVAEVGVKEEHGVGGGADADEAVAEGVALACGLARGEAWTSSAPRARAMSGVVSRLPSSATIRCERLGMVCRARRVSARVAASSRAGITAAVSSATASLGEGRLRRRSPWCRKSPRNPPFWRT